MKLAELKPGDYFMFGEPGHTPKRLNTAIYRVESEVEVAGVTGPERGEKVGRTALLNDLAVTPVDLPAVMSMYSAVMQMATDLMRVRQDLLQREKSSNT